MRLTWPLIGRAKEVGLIEAALSDPAVAGIVVSGPAGVGKSRIAREALHAAASKGFMVRWVVGTSCGRDLPLAAAASWPGLVGSDSVQLVCGVIDALTATDIPVVVGVDDPHLIDDLSMFLVHQIVQRRAAKVLITLRTDEPIPPAIQEVSKIGWFERIDLSPLPPEETTRLLAATLHGQVKPQMSESLWQMTHGNPLYLRQIVEQAVADGGLSDGNGAWHWTDEPVVPRGLVEVVESRIGALPEGVSTVVDALAVGEPIDLAVLRRIADADDIEEAEIRGLARLDTLDDRIEVRLAHPLYGEVRRAHAPVTRLRRLRGELAQQLAGGSRSDDVQVLVRRAALTLDSDLPADTDLLARAAQGAVYLADLALADRLAEAAERAGAGADAEFIRAHALSWLGRGDDAEELLARLPLDGLTDAERARFTYLRASNMLWALADPSRAERIIDDGAAAIDDGPSSRAIDALRLVYWFATDRPDAAMRTSEALVLDELPPIVGAETAWALASIHGDAGRTAEAVTAAETGYAIATRCSDAPHMRLNIADAHVGALLLAGRIGEALDVSADARGHAADLPGTAHLLGPAIQGRAELGAGRLTEACASLGQATAGLTATGHGIGWGYRYGVPNAIALAQRGLIADADAVLDELDGLQRPFRSLDYEKSLAQAWVAAGGGGISAAIDILRASASRAASDGRFAGEVLLLQTATQFGDRSCEPRLRELEAIVDGPRVGVAARFAAAMRDGDGDAMAFSSEDFEALGDRVAAVDAAAQACLAYRRRELRGSGLRCVTRAEALAEQCGAETPTLIRAREPLPLTDREREIVVMLGHGLSNRDVAGRLTLSVRTVEGHIYKAMTKTGTASREELAALLSPRKP